MAGNRIAGGSSRSSSISDRPSFGFVGHRGFGARRLRTFTRYTTREFVRIMSDNIMGTNKAASTVRAISLLKDFARCDGWPVESERWQECATCLRRIAPRFKGVSRVYLPAVARSGGCPERVEALDLEEAARLRSSA